MSVAALQVDRLSTRHSSTHPCRDRKHFERAPGHVAGAYCIRISSNGAVLLGALLMREAARMSWTTGHLGGISVVCAADRHWNRLGLQPIHMHLSHFNNAWPFAAFTAFRLLEARGSEVGG